MISPEQPHRCHVCTRSAFRHPFADAAEPESRFGTPEDIVAGGLHAHRLFPCEVPLILQRSSFCCSLQLCKTLVEHLGGISRQGRQASGIQGIRSGNPERCNTRANHVGRDAVFLIPSWRGPEIHAACKDLAEAKALDRRAASGVCAEQTKCPHGRPRSKIG